MVKEEYKKIEKIASAQQWLDNEYPKEKKVLDRKKENIVKLDISEEELEGTLKLEDFVGLNELECGNNKLTCLEIIDCPKLEVVYCRDNQIFELKIQKCPNLKRIYCERNKLIELNLSELKKLNELYCSNNQLMKLELADCSSLRKIDCQNNQLIFLDLTNCSDLENINCYKNQFTNLEFSSSPKLKKLSCYENQLNFLDLNNNLQLEELNCSNNQFTSLDLTKCSQLVKIDCYDNNLEELFFPFQGGRLNYLNVKNNNFPEQDLSIFRSFINLKDLIISNDDKKRISQGIYNHFCGSLEPLQKMNCLHRLDISNTDVSSGLTYLPESISYFYYLADLRNDAQVKIIDNLLANEKGETFFQKLKSIKRGEFRPQIDQVIFLVEQRRIADKISTSDLWKELKFTHKVDDKSISWQDYLRPALSLSDLNIRKNNILKVLKNLKEIADAKEKRFQEELTKQKEELEKKIRELEAKQLTENEKKILQKLEELFNVFGHFGDEKSENNKELAKVVKDYQKLDFDNDTPNLSGIFKLGGESFFSQIDTFVEKVSIKQQVIDSQEKLQTEVIQLQTELEKAKENCEGLVAEITKKDSEINDSFVKRERLQLKIDSLQKRLQKDEEELKLFPQKISNTKEEIKMHVHGAMTTTAPLWKKKDMLEKEEKKLQKSVEKSKAELERSKREESHLHKFLEKAKDDSQKKEINIKIKTAQEKIEKLERELNSQLETRSIITQIEVKNNSYV